MTTLPFAEEIRNARRMSEEAAIAAALLHRVQANLQSLEIIDRQHRANPSLQPPIPGGELINSFIDQWPTFAGLTDLNVSENPSYLERINGMKLQQQAVENHLRPITAEEHERAHQLSHLQADQQKAMAAPEWAEVAAQLRKIGTERDQLAVILATGRQKVAVVKPTQTALNGYLNQILREQASENTNEEIRNARVRALATAAIDSVRAIAAVSKLELGLPEPIEASSTVTHIDASIESLRELLRAVNGQLSSLEEDVAGQQSAFDKLTADLLRQLG